MIGYKNIGETTLEFVTRIRKEENIPSTVKVGICGKLDPQAYGQMRILVDKDTKLMDHYQKSSKTYEFDIVVGVSTDSDDIMGTVESICIPGPPMSDGIKNYMKNTIFNIKTQKFHHISAMKIRKDDGPKRPLWHWYKLGILKESDIPSKRVNVFSLECIGESTLGIDDYKSEVYSRLHSVTDKTRWDIANIWESWDNLLLGSRLIRLSYRINVSSGFYIRMIAKDIKRTLNIPVHIFNIHRIGME